MFGTMSSITSAFFGNGGRNMLVATVLAASLVSGDTVVDLLLGDSSIGESDIRFAGKVVGSIIDVDSTATTYQIACATTGTIPFPYTTPACISGDYVTITQGPSTMFLSEVFVTSGTSQNLRENCAITNSDTVTCFLTTTVSAVIAQGTQSTTTTYTQSSSMVNSPPSNLPLYFSVTITAGLEKINGSQATATPTSATGGSSASTTSSGSTTTSSKSSGAEQTIVKRKWTLLSTLFIIIYLAS